MTVDYVMRISRLTIDKLGVKLYDRVAAVLAELVANSYDADATKVVINAPMGVFLAKKVSGNVVDLGYEISIQDDGHGMTPTEMQDHYLIVGAERRTRGEKSRTLGRPVMGRKGIGKLAPFGICATIEILSSGGEVVERDGARGYLTSHITMDRTKMMTPEETNYKPDPGHLDGTLQPSHGTKITLRLFAHRSVPDLDSLARQLAHRFGVYDDKWEMTLVDSENPDDPRRVGLFDIELMDETKIEFRGPAGFTFPTSDVTGFETVGPGGADVTGVPAYLQDGAGTYYPIRGWIAYALYRK